MSLTYVNATCHCGLNQFKTPFLTSNLPFASDLCHCTSCRYITGELAVHWAVMHGKALDKDSEEGEEKHKEASLAGLTKYNASTNLTRYFCTTCSAYMLYEMTSAKKLLWSISTGVLEKVEGIVKAGYHIFVGDTLGGGLADHYRTIEGAELPRYESEEGGKTLLNGPSLRPATNRITAFYHCKTISLVLIRSTNKSKWAVQGKTATEPLRFVCGHCLCQSCRLTSVSLIQSWVFLHPSNVLNFSTNAPVVFAKDGSPEAAGRMKGVKQYSSSSGVYRNTFKVDVGAGLLDETDGGARAENFCFFNRHVMYPGGAIDKARFEALEEGVKSACARRLTECIRLKIWYCLTNRLFPEKDHERR
ncbi:Mss4-like protein [Crassisporium funariophilum]|nr:Mss4-like protein [Crassisporium funariophilum]